jgi:alkyl hydroperoxide reductase subunit AhpF
VRRGPASLDELLSVPGDPVCLIERAAGDADARLDALAARADWLTVRHERAPGETTSVEVTSSRPQGEVRFVGRVEGRLLEALVLLLVELATGDAAWEGPSRELLASAVTSRHELLVAATPSCPYCPSVVAAALRFAQAAPSLAVTIVRADLERVAGVTATPTVLVDGAVVSTGPVGEYALAERVVAVCGGST